MTTIPEAFYYQPCGRCFEVRTRKGDNLVCLTDTEARAAHIVRAMNMHAEEHSPFRECCGPMCCLVYSLGLSLIGGMLTAGIAYGIWAWGRG